MTSNKRVAFLNSSKFWGGGEQWHFRTATLLAQRGLPITFFCYPGSVLQQRLRSHAQITVVPLRVSNLSFLNPVKILFFARLLRSAKIETLIANSPNDIKLAGLSKLFYRGLRLIFRRGQPHPLKNSFINRFLFQRMVNLVIANSQDVRRGLNVKNPQLVPQERIVVIYNGIDVDAFEQRTFNPVVAREDGVWYLGNGGRLVEQKNQKDLLYLSQRLKRDNIRHKLLIAGTGKLEQELKQLAKQLQVDDCVEFVGFLENIKDLLECIDIFVFPSKFEGMSNMLVEALASGTPIVAYDVSSNAEVISADETGFLAPEDDIDRLAKLCKTLIEDTNLRTTFSTRCRQSAHQRFSEQGLLEQVIAQL